MTFSSRLLVLCTAIALPGAAAEAQSPTRLSRDGGGAVYNLHLVTDNAPDYTDLASFVESSTGAWQTPQDKCIAVWRWGRRSRRQTSCAVEHGRHIWDPILHYNSYGAMNCGIISSLNICSWLQLGYRARYVQLGDHTVSEVSWDGGKTWHLFDSSMSFFCYNHDGQVAGCQEIKEAHACELSGGKAEPGHYYYYHGAPQCVSHPGPTGWRTAADNPVGYARTLDAGASSYTDGFSADQYCQNARWGHRCVLNVRPCESYTRYWRPLDNARKGGDTAADDPDYFRPLANGSDPDDQHGLNNIRASGVWVFEPDLADRDCRKLFYDSAAVASSAGTGGPNIHPAEAGAPAQVTFQVSAANVITSMRIEAAFRRKTEADALRILVSPDAGIRWMPVWPAESTGPQRNDPASPAAQKHGTPPGKIDLALREAVAGFTQCWIKFEMLAAADNQGAGLDTLKVTTVTQLNRRTLPLLARGTNQVLLRADEQAETVEFWPALHAGAYKQTAAGQKDVASDEKPDGIYKATLGAAVNGTPCSVTWRLGVPTDITDVAYCVVGTVRSPKSYVSLLHSWDGKEFNEFERLSGGGFPFDSQVRRILSGSEVPAGARQAFFRAVFFCSAGAATYNMPGIQDLLVRVHHKPRDDAFRPIEVTYHWTEHRDGGDFDRSHTELVARLPHRYVINVAGRRDPTMNSLRINLKGYGHAERPPPAPAAARGQGAAARYGYSDGIDVGPGCEQVRVAYRWGKSLAVGKPYSAGRPSSTRSGNPDSDGRELTNGIVIAPTDSCTSGAVRAATAFWDAGPPVAFVVDLEAAQQVGAVRIVTHQPNDTFCHPRSIEVAVSADGQTWQPAGVLRHDDLWNPPGDYEAWEHDDDPSYAGLPAGGRLAYAYPLAFERPMKGRYVRLVCTPLDGKGMGLSEFQVFDGVTVVPWPAEIRLPDGPTPHAAAAGHTAARTPMTATAMRSPGTAVSLPWPTRPGRRHDDLRQARRILSIHYSTFSLPFLPRVDRHPRAHRPRAARGTLPAQDLDGPEPPRGTQGRRYALLVLLPPERPGGPGAPGVGRLGRAVRSRRRRPVPRRRRRGGRPAYHFKAPGTAGG